jgi:hypothetical protein
MVIFLNKINLNIPAMKKTLLILFLSATAISFANESYERLNNSDIVLSKNGKALEVIFDTRNSSPVFKLTKLGEMLDMDFDYYTNESAVIVNFKDYRPGPYILTVDDEYKSEDVLIYVEEANIRVIDRRVFKKPVYQFKDNKFKIKVFENTTLVDVVIESLSGDVLHNKKYTSVELDKTVFLLSEEVGKCVVNLNYKRKDFTKAINFL